MKPFQSIALAALAVTGLAGGALGAIDPPTSVGEVVVVGGPPPKMVASFPADGAAVAAGMLALKIVFDQAMTPKAWSYGRSSLGAFPDCLEQPRLLADQRTFVLLCTAKPHTDYAIEINAPRDFASESGRSAKPSILRFSTTTVGPRDMHDALAQAGLSDADEPIMAWKDDGAGVSRSTADARGEVPPGP